MSAGIAVPDLLLSVAAAPPGCDTSLELSPCCEAYRTGDSRHSCAGPAAALGFRPLLFSDSLDGISECGRNPKAKAHAFAPSAPNRLRPVSTPAGNVSDAARCSSSASVLAVTEQQLRHHAFSQLRRLLEMPPMTQDAGPAPAGSTVTEQQHGRLASPSIVLRSPRH